MLVILFLSIFATNSFAQIEVYDVPDFNQIENFNKTAYAGIWYDIFRIPNVIDFGDKCSVVTYELNQQLGSYKMTINAINTITKKYRNSIAAALPKENQQSAFTFRYPIVPPIDLGTIYILDTDYENYAVWIGIIPLREYSWMFAFITSRKPTLSSEYYKKAVEILSANNAPIGALLPVEQTCSNIINT
ncbi:crustacyanin-A2 subunit-like [Aphidius gifuensis]|uniref:crustacyanin-A2 subunit-like n=1 Tax=Aphidius gifuensis TaxID=684658 RepID=UPI001CDB6D3C|nr:crustacyanin-A2 subunit-like [Aphidius gifuensis]